eukprot:3739687-Karenia_brevis.AAC.1
MMPTLITSDLASTAFGDASPVQEIEGRLKKLNLQGLATSMWAFSTAGYHQHSLISVVAKVCLK